MENQRMELSRRLKARRSEQMKRSRTPRSMEKKSEEKLEDQNDSDSQKTFSKDSRYSRRISISEKSGKSPVKQNNLETTVDIEPLEDTIQKSTKEISRPPPGRSVLKRTINVQSLDIESAEDSSLKTEPMNVVVDVHCENEVRPQSSRRSSRQKSPSPPRRSAFVSSDEDAPKNQPDNIFSKSFKKQESEQISDRIQDIIEYPTKLQTRGVRQKEATVDLTRDQNLIKKTVRGRKENKSPEASTSGPRPRKRWSILETIYVSDDVKKGKKPWSEEVSSDVFWQDKTKSSWDTSSEKEDSPKTSSRKTLVKEQLKKPVPAPRSKSQKSINVSSMAFDNEAFSSEHEEVLRIETNPENRKIKMSLETVGTKTEEKSPSKRPKSTSKSLNRKTERCSSGKSESSDFDSDDRRLRQRIKSPKKKSLSNNSEDEPSSLFRKNSFTITKPIIRSKLRRKSGGGGAGAGSEDTSNMDNESSISQTSKRDIKSRRNSEEISSDVENSQKSSSKHKMQIIHSKYSGQETSLSTNEEEESDIDQAPVNQQIRKKIPKIKKNRSSEIREIVDSDNGRRQIEKRKKSESCMSRTSSSTRGKEFLGEDTAGRKKKKKRRKKKEEKEEQKEMKFISIIVHRSDVLEIDYITRHPMVKVHIVNANTGNYLKNHESGGKNDKSYLQPIITGKFDIKEHRSIKPIWEEELIFEHDFDDILRTEDEQVLIFFEIIDLLSFSEASLNYNHYGSEGCWHRIAWAFLRPVGSVGLHINKKVRLQLFRPRKSIKKLERKQCEVYAWWKLKKREKYPSSLYITVSPVEPPKIEPVYYEQLTLNELSDIHSDIQRTPQKASDEISLPKWSRLTAQSCKIPNKLLFQSETFDNGSFYIAFSNDGKFLACTVSEEYEFPIIVYKVDEKKISVKFSGHKNFVYSLNWSQDDRYLLSVSSDQTARLWDVSEKIVQHIQLLPHPSYVYCGKFDPANSSIVITGCYDHIARVWAMNKNSETYELVQELEVHEGFVNSICFQKDGSLLTADSVGVIILWIIKKNRKGPMKKEWQVGKKIKLPEIEATPINTIVLHPRGSRLLVHSRNNGLRLLDLATGVVLQKYEGLENRRIQTAACISPCATLVFCGGEDATLNVWNLETGKHLAKYSILDSYNTVSCVDYHPYDHVLAFSTFGNAAPFKLLIFDKNSTGDDVGLQLLINTKSTILTNSELAVHSLENSRTKTLWSSSTKRRSLEDSTVHPRTFNSGESLYLHKFGGSTGQLIENEDVEYRKVNLKMKLQRFMESGPSLKTRSMNRLNNIIEKIDRILLNASSAKSPVDLELAVTNNEQNLSLVTTNPKLEREKRNSKSTIFKDNSDDTIHSTLTDEAIEMQTFPKERKPWTERSKSAKALRSPRRMEEELLKTFSDSAVICREKKSLKKHRDEDEEVNYFENFNKTEMIQIYENQRKNLNSSSSGSVVIHQYGFPGKERPESPDSDGTYVVEKGDLEKNTDIQFEQVFGSGSSIKSNVTFTVVSEIADSKPRKKKITGAIKSESK